MVYKVINFIIGSALRIYYRKIEIINAANLETKGPSIIIANHPNTLMDALIIAYTSKQPIYFLAKATLFNSKWKLWLLQKMYMIPINRAGESKVEGINNSNSFDACFKKLEEGKRILIFPEGSSFKERVLRKLKTGAARISLELEHKHQGTLGIQIIPIGINYSDPERFQSKVLVSVGRPIMAKDYIADFEKDFIAASRNLTHIFREQLELLLITSHDQLDDKLFDVLREILSSKYLYKDKDNFDFLKELKIALSKIRVSDPNKYQYLMKLAYEIKWKSEKLAIKADFIDRRFRSIMFIRQMLFSIIGLFIAFPVFIYGFFHNGLQYKMTDWLTPKITKEIEYYAPLAVLFGLILYPLVYFGFIVLLHQLIHVPWYAKIIYYASLPVSGILAFYIHKYYQHVSFKWRYFLLMFNQKESLLEIKNKRNELRQLLGI